MSNLNKAATVKQKGTVIFYDRAKGFGFVNGSNGQRYHLGFNAITGEWIPAAGDRVEFIVSKRLNKQDGLKALKLLSYFLTVMCRITERSFAPIVENA